MEKINNESKVLNALRLGDAQAFDTLYHHYSKPVFRKLVNMVKHVPLAEELTQDVFVKIWDKRAIIDIEKPFLYYLLTVANHTVSDFYRKAARVSRLQEEIISASAELYNPIEEQLFYKESRDILDSAIENLPAQQKMVFKLCKIEGKSYEEVSQELGISTSTISNHIVKATKTIKMVFFGSKSGFVLLVLSLLQNKT